MALKTLVDSFLPQSEKVWTKNVNMPFIVVKFPVLGLNVPSKLSSKHWSGVATSFLIADNLFIKCPVHVQRAIEWTCFLVGWHKVH